MSLGVLNNISAIYAENNLNKTSSSLSTVLNQLSSGSKINSGADDAAGLSLVNGLQANQQALTQSATNATEGVGLLTVADGALSQVTSLLNRAVTLATEASNGTLNSTQDMAANQEYQSILSEISNIGKTTTYNQETVFGSKTNIYTGDSSTSGSSINSLNIRSLSSSNVGDTSGAMSYTSGADNVFINLSKGGNNASVNDSLGTAATTTTIAVNYMTKGSNGSAVSATANISVGAGTSYANTAQGLISAINNSGLGLTASFGTAKQAGTTAVAAAAAAETSSGGGATDTGIIISGANIGVNSTGSDGTGEVGTLTVAASGDALSGTLSIVGSDGATHNVTLGTANSTDNIANLASTINAAGYGVTAAVDVSGKVLTFTSAASNVSVSGTNIQDSVHAASVATLTPATLAPATTGSIGTLTTTNATDLLSGSITINGEHGVNHTFTLGTSGSTDTLANLANTINAFNTANGVNFGVAVTGGTTLTFTATAVVGATETPSISGTITSVVAAGTPTADSLTGIPTASGTAQSTTLGTVKTDASGNTLTFGTGGSEGTFTETGDMAKDVASINAGKYGVTATLNSAGTAFTLSSANSSMTVADSVAANYTAAPTTSAQYYSIGISSVAGVTDTSTNGGTANVGIVGDSNGSGGVATISYSDSAGTDLSNTDLSSQSDAQAALTALNAAISNVAAQDGYIGAQINTLNSVSSVLSTQSENVTSAQNAVQATDYASATSAMSKYEILSQTGIAALAQANSVQQEVTKLLQ